MVADVRWEGFSHRELYAFAHGGTGPAPDHEVARQLRAGRDELLAVDAELRSALDRLGATWSGAAAEASRTGLTPLGQWVLEATTTFTDAGVAHDHHAEAVAHVMREMPVPAAPARPETAPLTADWAAQEALAHEAEQRAVGLMQAYGDAVPGRMDMLVAVPEPPVVTVAGAPAAAGDTGSDGPGAFGSGPAALSAAAVGATPAGPSPAGGGAPGGGAAGGGAGLPAGAAPVSGVQPSGVLAPTGALAPSGAGRQALVPSGGGLLSGGAVPAGPGTPRGAAPSGPAAFSGAAAARAVPFGGPPVASRPGRGAPVPTDRARPGGAPPWTGGPWSGGPRAAGPANRAGVPTGVAAPEAAPAARGTVRPGTGAGTALDRAPTGFGTAVERPAPRDEAGYAVPPPAGGAAGVGTGRSRPGSRWPSRYLLDDVDAFDVDIPHTSPVIGGDRDTGYR